MSVRCLATLMHGGRVAACTVASLVTVFGVQSVLAIDVKVSIEEAQKALEAGRAPMEKANTPEEVKKVLQQASMVTRVGAHPV